MLNESFEYDYPDSNALLRFFTSKFFVSSQIEACRRIKPHVI